jgi:hypothetical protein
VIVRPFLLATVVVAAALALAWPGASLAAVKTKTETASGGQVQTVLTYKVGPQRYDVSGTHLTITRAGAKLLDIDVPQPCKDCAVIPAGFYGSGKSIQIVDLDGDGEPEVVFDMNTGGAHCCENTWIYRFTGTSYVGTPRAWGDTGYTLKDLNGDGIPELRSFDDRFAYEFTAYAESWFPLQIFQYRAGKLTDVTRQFPKPVAADAGRTLRFYRRHIHSRAVDLRGVIGAYVADEYLLGHGSRGWKLVSSARKRGLVAGLGKGDVWPHGAGYPKALRRFLKRTGYIR